MSPGGVATIWRYENAQWPGTKFYSKGSGGASRTGWGCVVEITNAKVSIKITMMSMLLLNQGTPPGGEVHPAGGATTLVDAYSPFFSAPHWAQLRFSPRHDVCAICADR